MVQLAPMKHTVTKAKEGRFKLRRISRTEEAIKRVEKQSIYGRVLLLARHMRGDLLNQACGLLSGIMLPIHTQLSLVTVVGR